MEEIIVGVVGVLQFDVLKYRLENEYNVEIRLENLPYEHIRWIENEGYRYGQAGRHIRYEEDQGSERQTASSVCQQLEHPYDAGTKRRTEAFRIRTFLKNFAQ